MVNVSPSRSIPDVALRPRISSPFAHRRKTVYMSAPRYLNLLSYSRCAKKTSTQRAFSSRFSVPIECDKSFTRSDALAKHMRLQHNISPPLPGRGNRKRKRPEATAEPAPSSTPAPIEFYADPGSVKHEGEEDYRRLLHLRGDGQGLGVGGEEYTPPPGVDPNQSMMSAVDAPPLTHHPLPLPAFAAESSDDEFLPPSLLPYYDHETGLVHGRPPMMAKYLVMKAKHKYALGEHELLLDELQVVRLEEQRMRKAKEEVLNEVLRREIGCVVLINFSFRSFRPFHLF